MPSMRTSHTGQQVQQLQQLDPAMWSLLLRRNTGVDDLRVDAVHTDDAGQNRTRYILYLDNHSDPITLLGVRTSLREARFFSDMADGVPFLVPRCYLAHVGGREGWVVLADAPNDLVPEAWSKEDVVSQMTDLAALHSVYQGDRETLLSHSFLPFLLGQRRKKRRNHPPRIRPTWERQTVSDHAIRTVEGLAPQWLEAAQGLRILLDLEGWQHVIDEKHLRALGDLIDDPQPMLQRLRELPLTLVHGFPGIYNWRVSLFDSRQLVDWSRVAIGPGVCDMVAFVETFGLLQGSEMGWKVRDEWPLSEETMIDAYILGVSAELGSDALTRDIRQAIPAARCLHIMLTWLPRFYTWFKDLPADRHARREMWQSINRIGDDDLAGTLYAPIAGLRPHLTEVFHRFLRSSYQI